MYFNLLANKDSEMNIEYNFIFYFATNIWFSTNNIDHDFISKLDPDLKGVQFNDTPLHDHIT